MIKKIVLCILGINLLFITACTSNHIDIPDPKTGQIQLPNGWVFEVIDGWIHIRDEADEVVGTQWDYGDYWNVGQEIHDEKIVNPLFEDYVWIEVVQTWGGSNGSAVNLSVFDVIGEKKELYFITFFSYTHDRYEISIFMFDVPLETLISISESYNPY